MRTAKFKNYKMSDDTYKLRTQVMDIIYNAKKYAPDLPRLDVRVGKASGNVLGSARMGENKIWIDVNKIGKKDLVSVVLHEILHAVYSTPHDKKCDLMSPELRPMSNAKAYQTFGQYITRYKNRRQNEAMVSNAVNE